MKSANAVKTYRKSGVAKRRDLRCAIRVPTYPLKPLPFCHPDRSEAKRRDLRFYGPFLKLCRQKRGFPPFIPQIPLHESIKPPFDAPAIIKEARYDRSTAWTC